MQWLPEFALTESERQSIGSHNAVELVGRAANSVYKSQKTQSRGEIGEILLHVIVRQVFGSLPAISKYYYKDSANDTVKGFDAVHVVADEDNLELWLGEVKFYKNISGAISDVIAEIKEHTEDDYLRSEFTAITNKIDDAWPHADTLRNLIRRNRSLDEIFTAICIPVLLTYDSGVVGGFEAVCEEYERRFEEEVRSHYETFAGKDLPKKLRVHLALLPMKSKDALVAEFDRRLKACQIIT